ncbi:MAG: chloride channel protein [Acidobacteria bacterium]|nr:chloride channel protein [Acidobacteriota bacterium]MXZ71821.1 chloride channel protein [Acidobacteriota bacterium]MYD72302.1 chloride channel protein [Acidobacteriota bacterium]MYJ04189.1 chloride channel protein [Acidobacteriota bacterium]
MSASDLLERVGGALARISSRLSVWRWARVWLRSSFLPEQNYLIILAVVVGVLTGLGSVGFIYVLEMVADFARGPVASLFDRFGAAQLVLLPALGGLMVGPLVQRFAKEAKGHGVPEVMTALARFGGYIRKRVVTVKVIASSLTIGFGGTAGREGPMVQIGAAIGSIVGQWTRLTTTDLRTLVSCGAAGGVAATFNAPIAGAIFSMEVLIGRIRTDFLLVLLTSLSSCLVARYFLGNFPAFMAPTYSLVSPAEVPLYFLMGTIMGAAATAYVRMLYWSEDVFGRWRFPEWLKPAVGGLMVGLVIRFFPEVYGSSFEAIESALWVRFDADLLWWLFIAALVANCATLGSGGSGGVFAPSLYMGAMLGGVFGSFAHAWFPDWTAGSGAYAMVGMAAFFAAAAKAPTTAIIILFEMTNDYRIMLPLMAAVVGSVYISHRYSPFSIYTLRLHRRGIPFPYVDTEQRPTSEEAPATSGRTPPETAGA